MQVPEPSPSVVPPPPPDRPDHGYGAEHRRTGPLRDWRLKAAVQTLLGWLPNGEGLNHLLQRHVTRTLPITDAELEGQVAKAWRNVETFARLGPRPLADAHFYEFGVGWDMLMPLVYAGFGVRRQTVVDITALARVELVRDAAERLTMATSRMGLPSPPRLPPGDVSAGELVAPLGIDYRAPADARRTGLPDAIVDMVSSADVLEHVPVDDIRAILIESRRILRDDGLMRIRIDYQDHYWYFDERASPYGFLRFDEDTWRRFNPSLHFQNRLRHDGLLALVDETGWQVVEEDRHQPSADDLRTVASMPLAEPFRSMPPERLAIRYANLTLAKARDDARR